LLKKNRSFKIDSVQVIYLARNRSSRYLLPFSGASWHCEEADLRSIS